MDVRKKGGRDKFVGAVFDEFGLGTEATIAAKTLE
jgi:hypothetical protein